MTIDLLYGKDGLAVTPPDGCAATVIQKSDMPVLADPAAAVARAIAAPTGSPLLADLARDAKSACILICDITRPVPNGLLLPVLLRALMDAGLDAGAIRIVVATGLHRPNEGDELAEVVGDRWVMETVEVANHFARDAAAHVAMGTTSKGTRIGLDRRFVDADLRIAVGLVEPHFMAGWSGGRKVIAPGIADAETITTFHSERFMSHPKAANCLLDGNPLHEEQLEVVAMLGGALAMNVVIDDARALSFVNFGEVVASHLEAVDFGRRYVEVPVPRRFPTVVTSAAGYPLDKTYYQTVKGMVGPLDILQPGGDLIIASRCSEGLGSAEFIDAQRRLVDQGIDGFMTAIAAKSHADIDEWQTQMQVKSMRAGRVRLFSEGLTAADAAVTGIDMVPSVEAAIADSIERHGDGAVAFVPEGPYIVPYHAPE